jgi:catechol 2,3-dioxygenase-like lactoylglutathione lyase family enzyme
MFELKLTSVTIGIPVTSVEQASDWYERCLELEGHIDPAADIREYELVPGCWLQLSETDTAPSEHCLLLGVAELDRERERLAQLGVEMGDIQRVEGVIAFCDFKDPDGNNLSLYHVEQT